MGSQHDANDGNQPQPDATVPAQEPLQEIHIAPLTPDAPEASGTEVLAPVELFSKDEFFIFFGSLFAFTGNAMGMVPPLNQPMQSLVAAPNLPTARPASDAVYDMAQKYDWLRWLIEKDADNIKGLIFIGTFGMQLAASVRNEVQMRANLIAQMQREYEQPHSDERPPAAPSGQTVQ